MGDFGSSLGLLFEISADPTHAQQAIAQFEKVTGESFKELARKTQPLDKAILNNRESTRLLGEEMGIHLPRAVSGAVAKMLPDIGQLGGALLGGFAAEKVYEWSAAGVDKIREMYTVVDQDIKLLDAAAAAAFKHAGKEAEEMLTHFKTSLAGAFELSEINARADQLLRYHNAYKLLMDKAGGDLRVLGTISSEAVTTVAAASREGLNNLAAVDQKVAENGQLQFDAHKRLAEVVKKESHEMCEAAVHDQQEAARAARQTAELLHRQFETEKLIHEWRYRGMAEAGKQIAEQTDADNKLAKSQQFLMNLDLQWSHLTDGLGKTRMQLSKEVRSTLPLFYEEAEATRHVSNAFKEHAMMSQYATEFTEQFTGAIQQQIQAVKEDWVGSTEALTAGLAGLIGGRRAQAGVEMVWEIAKGIQCLAEGAWPPNPAAIVAAGLHFESAAQYGILAGKSSGHHARAGGGAGSYAAPGGDYRARGADRMGLPPPSTLAPGAGGGGGRFAGLHVTIIGEHEAGQWLAGTLNKAVDRGIRLNATTSQRGSPVGH